MKKQDKINSITNEQISSLQDEYKKINNRLDEMQHKELMKEVFNDMKPIKEQDNYYPSDNRLLTSFRQESICEKSETLEEQKIKSEIHLNNFLSTTAFFLTLIFFSIFISFLLGWFGVI